MVLVYADHPMRFMARRRLWDRLLTIPALGEETGAVYTILPLTHRVVKLGVVGQFEKG